MRTPAWRIADGLRQRAYDVIMPINPQLAILQCTAGYPAAFHELDLRVISTYRDRFPGAVVGFSSHDNGIAIVPQATVAQEHKQGTLAVLPFRGKEFTRPLAILHRKGRVLTPAMKKFIETLGLDLPDSSHA